MEIYDNIENFLSMENTGALMIVGAWGSGKTYYIDKEAIRFSFNSKGRSFFVMSDGSFINIRIKKVEGEPIQYSSVSRPLPQLSGAGLKSPLKAAVVPNGCVVEFFDKVILYQNNDVHLLEETPVYGIRTYMGSRNYTDIVTVTKEDSVSFHSVEVFSTINSARMFPHQ